MISLEMRMGSIGVYPIPSLFAMGEKGASTTASIVFLLLMWDRSIMNSELATCCLPSGGICRENAI